MNQSYSDFTLGILPRQRNICAIKLVSCLPFKRASLTRQIKLDTFPKIPGTPDGNKLMNYGVAYHTH